MAAIDFFEGILTEGERIRRISEQLALLDSRISPHGQGFEPMGHGGGGSDRMLAHAILSDKLGELRAQLPNLQRRHEEKLERATDVLYGKSGRGGLAKATCTDDADMLLFHYCQGESWASIARRYEIEDANLTRWCQRRAVKVCRVIDRIGMDALADS